MTIERVNPPTLARPSGFSHAIVATGSRLVFLAGQTALDATGAVVGDTVAASSSWRWLTCWPRCGPRAARPSIWPA